MDAAWARAGLLSRKHTFKDMKSKESKGIVQDEKIELSSIKSRMGKTTIELENISKAYDCKVLIK